MSSERMSVSLDDFIKYFLGKWKYILICMIVCIAFSGVSTRLFGNKIVISPDEKYADLKEQEEYFEEYIDNSVLMDMNPMNIYEKTIFIDHVSDRNALKEHIESRKIWEKSNQALPAQYLAELVSWEEQSSNQGIQIKVQHSEETECEKLADYLAQQIQEFDNKAEVTVGGMRTVIDKSISDEQMWCVNRLQDIKGQLEYTAAGCSIEVSDAAAIVLGILLGGLSSFVIFLCLFLLQPELRSVDEIEYYTKAKLIGKAAEVKTKKSVPEIESIDFQNELQSVTDRGKKVVLIDLTEYGRLSVEGTEIVRGLDTEDEKEKINTSDVILIAASANKTSYNSLKAVLDYLDEKEKEIYGCIAC